jgi:DNA repair protein RadC
MPPKKLSLKEIPQDERPREKLMGRGEESLSDAELLAIILGAGSKAESALQLAQRILKQAGDLKTLSNLSIRELREFHGIGPARATQLKSALELSRRLARSYSVSQPRFSNSTVVYEHFHEMFRGKQQEEFWVLAVDAKNKLLVKSRVFKGTLMGSPAHPREVFRVAIKNSAAGIIVLHNHPSGDPAPSLEDRKVTNQLAEAGRLLGIPLLDHLIIGNGAYYSFKDEGAL